MRIFKEIKVVPSTPFTYEMAEDSSDEYGYLYWRGKFLGYDRYSNDSSDIGVNILESIKDSPIKGLKRMLKYIRNNSYGDPNELQALIKRIKDTEGYSEVCDLLMDLSNIPEVSLYDDNSDQYMIMLYINKSNVDII